MVIVGAVGILVGLVLLAYGLAPVKQIVDVVGPTFSGGPPPDDLGEQLDAAIARLKARALVDVFGFVASLGGIVAVKSALAPPKPKPVEQLVQEEVARRMAGMAPVVAANPVASSPAAAGPSSSPAASPVAGAHSGSAEAGPVRKTHCACGSVLIAGGRICPQGHAQA